MGLIRFTIFQQPVNVLAIVFSGYPHIDMALAIVFMGGLLKFGMAPAA